MLSLRHLRRVSQLCLHPQSIASSLVSAPGSERPCIRREGGTYTVDQATNIKWFEGAVSRSVPKDGLAISRGASDISLTGSATRHV